MQVKMIRIPTGRPGVSIQITEAEAARLGYLKKREPVQNKKRAPAKNKAVK